MTTYVTFHNAIYAEGYAVIDGASIASTNSIHVAGLANHMALSEIGTTLLTIGKQKIEASQPNPVERPEANATEAI